MGLSRSVYEHQQIIEQQRKSLDEQKEQYNSQIKTLQSDVEKLEKSYKTEKDVDKKTIIRKSIEEKQKAIEELQAKIKNLGPKSGIEMAKAKLGDKLEIAMPETKTNSNAVDNKSTTDGFDGAGVGEDAGLESYIKSKIDSDTSSLAGSLSSFFKKVADFFEPDALDTTTTDDTTTDETDDASAIVERGTVSLAKLNDIIDKNVPNGTAREKRVYVTKRINELNKELSAPVKTRNSEDIKTLISAYESILKDIDKEIFAEKLKEQQDRLKDAGNAGRLAGKAGITLDTPTTDDISSSSIEDASYSTINVTGDGVEQSDGSTSSSSAEDLNSPFVSMKDFIENGTTVDADELNKRINDNIERSFSIGTDDETSVGTYVDITPEERAELDKMNEGSNNIIEYAKLTDQELSSKMNEINSQMAGLQAEADELENKYRNGEISIREYNAQLDAIDDKEYALYEDLMNVQSAITYKKEEKIIETMTDSQKAELESVNNKMIPLQEQACVASQRMIDLATKAVELNNAYNNGEITEEEYDAEMDKIDAQDKELQSAIDSIMKELEPLQAQRDEIFANAGKSDTPDIPVTPTATTGGTTSTDNLTEDEKKALERLKEVANGLQNVGNGVLGGTSSGITLDTPTTSTTTTSGTTTSTTWTTTTTQTPKVVTSKPKTNIFTKAADKVKSDDVEGVIDALNAKGITNTYTNARKVADAADVDITRSKYNKAMSGSDITEEVVDPDGAEFKFKKKLDDDKPQGFSMKF